MENKNRADHDDEVCADQENIVHKEATAVNVMVKRERSPPENNSMASSSTHKEQDHQIELAKAEMREVMEENQRLRMHLDRITKEYRNLQNQFHDIVQKEADQKSSSTANTTYHESDQEADQLVSLSLGRTTSDMKKDELSKIVKKDKGNDNEGGVDKTLDLGLDCKFKTIPTECSPVNLSLENSLEDQANKDENGETSTTWPPNKNLKTMRNNGDGDGDGDDVSQQNPTKRARVSVRVRCDATTMNDGCQWRKYGQKIAKGNPCPRAYYRCTVAPNCPVRKQVQRCPEDMSILITTYEGTHNHTLPLSATAMASTSAAASMLLSGLSSSSDPNPQVTATTTNTNTNTNNATSANINGLNFYLSDASRHKSSYYFPNSSFSASAPNSHPTITLDLTSTSSSSSSSLSHLNRMSHNFPPRYNYNNNNSSTNLNFSSVLESNSLPISWTNSSYPNQAYNKNNQNFGSLTFSSRPNHENIFQSYLQKNNNISTQSSLPPETIAAATKAITSDPNFHSVLAAALTSIIGNTGIENKLNVTEPFPILSSLPSTSNPNKCSSSFSNKPTSSASPNNTQQPGNSNLVFFAQSSSSLPFSTSNKGKSTSPSDSKVD